MYACMRLCLHVCVHGNACIRECVYDCNARACTCMRAWVWACVQSALRMCRLCAAACTRAHWLHVCVHGNACMRDTREECVRGYAHMHISTYARMHVGTCMRTCAYTGNAHSPVGAVTRMRVCCLYASAYVACIHVCMYACMVMHACATRGKSVRGYAHMHISTYARMRVGACMRTCAYTGNAHSPVGAVTRMRVCCLYASAYVA